MAPWKVQIKDSKQSHTASTFSQKLNKWRDYSTNIFMHEGRCYLVTFLAYICIVLYVIFLTSSSYEYPTRHLTVHLLIYVQATKRVGIFLSCRVGRLRVLPVVHISCWKLHHVWDGASFLTVICYSKYSSRKGHMWNMEYEYWKGRMLWISLPKLVHTVHLTHVHKSNKRIYGKTWKPLFTLRWLNDMLRAIRWNLKFPTNTKTSKTFEPLILL